MDEKDWLFLQALHEEKNVTRAAQKLFISQPALTYRIKQMEEQLDIQIFIRGRRNIKFTSEGEHLALYAKRMVIELQKLKDKLQDSKHDVRGELRLGVSSNFADQMLPDLLKKFNDIYPQIKFNVHTAWSVDVFKRLCNEEDHIGIIRGNYDWESSKILMGVNEVCLVSKKHINLIDLPTLPRIRHQSGPDTTKITDQWWNENFSTPPYISMEVDNLETCKKMVMKGLGYGILPNYSLSEIENPDEIFIYPLTVEGQPVLRKLWAFYREDDTKLSAVKAFVDFLNQHYAIK